MKTVLLVPECVKPKPQPNYNRTKIRANNMRSIPIDSIHKISDLVGESRMRESGNIFYLKFNDRNRTRTIPTQKYGSKDNANVNLMPEDESGPMQNSKTHKKQNGNGRYDGSVDQSDQYEQINRQVLRKITKQPQLNTKTLYFYKKQSLNTELQFFKAYNRFQKSKVYERHSFNTQLIGIQKSFYHKTKPFPSSKRAQSLSIGDKRKIQPSSNNNNAEKMKLSTRLEPIVLAESRGKKLLKVGLSKQKSKNLKQKHDQFEPWSYLPQDNDHYHHQ